LKTISCAQELYYTRHEKYGTLAELCKAKSLHESLEKAINPEHGKSGYYFLLTLTKDGWSCKAIPAVAGETGKRIFFVNQTGIIRTAPCESKDDPPANAKSPPLGR